MNRAGHKEKLSFKVLDDIVEKESNKRSRDVIWFNPPWSSNVRTNVGAKFISVPHLQHQEAEGLPQDHL